MNAATDLPQDLQQPTVSAVTDSEYFIIEADEYDRMFLGLRPKIIVLTSMEMDHPDMFGSIDDVRALFREFIDLLPQDGLLIACFDDIEVKRLIFQRLQADEPTVFYSNDLSSEDKIFSF